MTFINIEETILEYHRATGKNWEYAIEQVNEFPDGITEIRSVCINSAYVQFCEIMNIEKTKSMILWKLEFEKLTENNV